MKKEWKVEKFIDSMIHDHRIAFFITIFLLALLSILSIPYLMEMEQDGEKKVDIVSLAMRLKASEEYADKLEKSIKVKDKLIENQNAIINLQETAVKILKDEVRLYNSLINKQKEIVDRYTGKLNPQYQFYWAGPEKQGQCLSKN